MPQNRGNVNRMYVDCITDVFSVTVPLALPSDRTLSPETAPTPGDSPVYSPTAHYSERYASDGDA